MAIKLKILFGGMSYNMSWLKFHEIHLAWTKLRKLGIFKTICSNITFVRHCQKIRKGKTRQHRVSQNQQFQSTASQLFFEIKIHVMSTMSFKAKATYSTTLLRKTCPDLNITLLRVSAVELTLAPQQGNS